MRKFSVGMSLFLLTLVAVGSLVPLSGSGSLPLTATETTLNFKSEIRLIFWEVKSEPAYQSEAKFIHNKIMEILGNDFGVKILDRTLIEQILKEDALGGIVIETLGKYRKRLGSEYALDVEFFGKTSDLSLKLVNIVSGAVEIVQNLKYWGPQDEAYLRSVLERIYKYLRQPIKNPSSNIKLLLNLEPKELYHGQRIFIGIISGGKFTYLFVADLDGNLELLKEIDGPTATLSATAVLPHSVDELDEYVVAVALSRSSVRIRNVTKLSELYDFLRNEFIPQEWQIAFEKYSIIRGERK